MEAEAAPGPLRSLLRLDRGVGFDAEAPLACPIGEGRFAAEFRLPPGPPVQAVLWKVAARAGSRCRIETVETDGEYCGIAWKSTTCLADGFDEFLGGEPQYLLNGRFEAASWLRVRGELLPPEEQRLVRELGLARAECERQRRRAAQAKLQAQNARREAAVIKGSLSWRLTAPVRAALGPIVSRLRPAEEIGDVALEAAPEQSDAVAAAAIETGRVSVAIPVYNGARFLRETLESVLRQTYPPAEVILLDDASTDGSAEVILEFSRRDPRVRLVRNERNVGMVANWNRCLEQCAGDWVKLMGQDDRLEPECLETMLLANADGNDLVLSLRKFSFERGVPRSRSYEYQYVLPTLETLGIAPGTVTPATLARAITRVAPCTNILGEPVCGLFRRARLAEIGGFNPVLRQVVDYEFWLRLALSRPMTFVDQPLAIFRVHAGSATQANLTDRLRGVHVEYAILLIELLEGEAFADARRQHPPLAAFVRGALVSELGTLRRLARRSPKGRESLLLAQREYPPLAAWCRLSPTLADRVLTTRVRAASVWSKLAALAAGLRRR